MTKFVRAANPIWWLPDLTGQPLNGMFYAFFLTNDLPYVPQAVYQDPNGINPWSNPIQFSPAGTLPDNLYFDDTLTYRIEIRQGPTQADPLIWLIQNFQPGEEISTADEILTADNLITNPQFADIYFTSPYTITMAGTYDIAPGWQLVLSGTGSITVTQTAISGDSNIERNPTYYLTFQSSGWTQATLVQTFNNNGALFANGTIAISFLAFATTSSQILSLVYNPNGTTNSQTVFTGTIEIGTLMSYAGFINVNSSMNANIGTFANVELEFVLPVNGTISLTNIMFVGQSTPVSNSFVLADVPLYEELSYERIVDQEFHVFKDSLLTRSKQNILTGWNFGLNPWQTQSPSLTSPSSQITYIADQTILYQPNGNFYLTGQAAATFNRGLVLQTVVAGSPVDNRFALIQYIDIKTISPYCGQNLSCLVRAILDRVNSISVPIKMRLIFRIDTPAIISSSEPIVSWPPGTDPTFSSGWTEIIPQNDPSYIIGNTFSNSSGGGTDLPQHSFDKFFVPLINNNFGIYMGVVIYTMESLDNSVATQIIFDRISLVQNDFAIDCAEETFDESLRKCQFYYERSYEVGTDTSTTTFDNALAFRQLTYFIQTTGNAFIYPATFNFNFKETKCQLPHISFYSPNSGVIGNVYKGFYSDGSFQGAPNDIVFSTWWKSLVGKEGFTALPNNSGQIEGPTGGSPNWDSVIYFHYTCDARLGL